MDNAKFCDADGKEIEIGDFIESDDGFKAIVAKGFRIWDGDSFDDPNGKFRGLQAFDLKSYRIILSF